MFRQLEAGRAGGARHAWQIGDTKHVRDFEMHRRRRSRRGKASEVDGVVAAASSVARLPEVASAKAACAVNQSLQQATSFSGAGISTSASRAPSGLCMWSRVSSFHKACVPARIMSLEAFISGHVSLYFTKLLCLRWCISLGIFAAVRVFFHFVKLLVLAHCF